MVKRFLFLLALLVILAGCATAPVNANILHQNGTETAGATATSTPASKIFAGFTRPSWGQGEFGSYEEQQTFADMLSSVNPNCVGITVTQYLPYVGATQIQKTPYTATDADIVAELQEIQKSGNCSMLAPHVDFYNDNEHWGADIGKTNTGQDFSSSDWNALEASYTTMIVGYAQLCQAHGCTILSIGNEFTLFSQQDNYWHQLIAQIRTIYHGKLTYSSWWDSEKNQISWWGDLDYIGVNIWLPVANTGETDPTLDEIRSHWDNYLPTLVSLYTTYHIKILVTEAGYDSYQGMSAHPYLAPTSDSIPDQQEQANAYKIFFEKLVGQPWLAGFFLWYWPLFQNNPQVSATDVSVQGKLAEQVIASAFANLH